MVHPLIIVAILLSPAGFDAIVDVDAGNPLHAFEVVGEKMRLAVGNIDEQDLIEEYLDESEKLAASGDEKGLINAQKRLLQNQERLQNRVQEGELIGEGLEQALIVVERNQERIQAIHDSIDNPELRLKLQEVAELQHTVRAEMRAVGNRR